MLHPSMFAVAAVIALSATAASTQVIAALAGHTGQADSVFEPIARAAPPGRVNEGLLSISHASASFCPGPGVQGRKHC
jgi:hypothetical protein